MQIVIEISEEDKKELDDSIKGKGFSYFEKAKLIRKILFAVFHGKVIPKGHGRLIDADAVLVEPFGNTYKDIDTAETIIEADNLSDKYGLKAVTRGNCMICGKELTEGLFFCKECEDKASRKSEEIVISRNLCDSCKTKGCIFQSGIVRSHCDFYKAESEEE